MTGLKDALRFAIQTLQDSKDQALDYAASLIHSAMTDASSPFRFAPDALQVALLEGNTEVGGLKDSVILTMKGSRLIEGEIDLGFDLSGFDISNLDALKSLLGLSQPDLLSITALDGSLLRYAVSVDLDVAVELDANATVKFVKQDLSNGNYLDLADETVAPLSIRALADLGPTDISFAIDAGSLGKFGLVAEDSRFVFGKDSSTTPDLTKSLADQLRSKGAQLDFTVTDTAGTQSIGTNTVGGFGMGLALSRAFGETLQPISEFSAARISGDLLQRSATDIANGLTLPEVNIDFFEVPDDLNLRSLLMPQLDDFASFGMSDLINMVDTAYSWVFGVDYPYNYTGASIVTPALSAISSPSGSDLTAELPFVGQTINDLLPLNQIFTSVHLALETADQVVNNPGGTIQEALLTIEKEVNKAIAKVSGWDSPPVFSINFSTLSGNVWTSGIPHRALEIALDFDNAAVEESALSLDLIEALGLTGQLDGEFGLNSDLSAQLSTGVGISGKLVFGGALSEDASLQSLGSLQGASTLLDPILYIGAASNLALSFGAEASNVDVTLGFDIDGTPLNASITDGFIGLTNEAGDADASLTFTLTSDDNPEQSFFLLDNGGFKAAAGAVTNVGTTSASSSSTLARLTLDSAIAPGSSTQIVDVTWADDIANTPTATNADYLALGASRVGIVVSGASQFLVQETGIPSGQTSALSEGDTLQRVVSGATFRRI